MSPHALPSAHRAEGELVIRSGDTGRILYAEPAQVDLQTGALVLAAHATHISPTGYDWGVDAVCFRWSRKGTAFSVEEGSGSQEFCIRDDLEALQVDWAQKVAREWGRSLPKAPVRARGPRL